MLHIRMFYFLLLLAHMPIVFMFVIRLVNRRFVSESIVMHLSFTLFWLLNALRIMFLCFQTELDIPDYMEVLIVVQSICSIPLLAYLIPTIRHTLGLPCVGDIRALVLIQENLRTKKEQELIKVKEAYIAKLKSLARLVKIATRETKAQREFLRGKQGLETVGEWADQQLTILEDVNQKIVSELETTETPSIS